jgi:hypothetical protein
MLLPNRPTLGPAQPSELQLSVVGDRRMGGGGYWPSCRLDPAPALHLFLPPQTHNEGSPWLSVPASLFDYPCQMTASEHACVRMQSICQHTDVVQLSFSASLGSHLTLVHRAVYWTPGVPATGVGRGGWIVQHPWNSLWSLAKDG